MTFTAKRGKVAGYLVIAEGVAIVISELMEYILRFLRRSWPLLAVLVVLLVLAPLVGGPLIGINSDRRVLEGAANGDAVMQIQAGDLYGRGSYRIDVDFREAARWYRAAAEQGHPVGQMRLGAAYISGAGVEADAEAGLWWYLAAANEGWYDAMVRLSYLYEDGVGTEPDLIEAYRWVWLAYASGDPTLQDTEPFNAVRRSTPQSSAALYRKNAMVFQRMPDDQKEEAMRRAREWRPTHFRRGRGHPASSS